MKTFQFIPAILTLFIILGIIFGFYIQPKPIFVIGLLLCLIFLLSVSYYFANKSFSKNSHFNLVTYLLFFGIGIASITFQNQKIQKKHYANFVTDTAKIILVVKKQLKPNTYYSKYVTEVIQINKHKTIGTILLNIQKDSTKNTFKIEDHIFTTSKFNLINAPKNPYQFNYKKYLEKQQIYHQINVKKSEIKLLKTNVLSINSFAANFRKRINNTLKKHHFKKDVLAIINALLLGQRQNMSKKLLENYQNAGAVHILAVSGLHVGILFLLLRFLFKPIEKFKKGKFIKFTLIILFLWSFAILASLSASVVRAVTMFTAIAIGELANRKSNTLNNLFISMLVLLLIHPLFLFDVGFQLSYLAVFSIVFFYPKLNGFYKPKNMFTIKIWQLFTISLAAQIGILPLSLYYFHQFPSLFFVSSLVIIPLLSVILGLGILIIILSLLQILPEFLANFYGVIIHYMNSFIQFIAKQEAFLFKQISFSVLLLICSYLLLISSYRFIDKKNANRFTLVLLSVILFQIAFMYQKRTVQIKKEFVIFNKNRHTLITDRNGKNVEFFSNKMIVSSKGIFNNYLIGSGKLVASTNNSVKNIYTINNKKLLVIDSLGVFNIKNLMPEMLLLRQSPKINLERLIQNLQPKIIIADASNYKSYVKLWQKTCLKNSINFYSTQQKGAFRITQ